MYFDLIPSIYELTNNGIKLWLEHDKIKLFVPENISFTDKQKDFIKSNKDRIIHCLQNNQVYSRDYDVLILSNQSNQSILSFAQERLWFIENYEVGTNAYNVPMVFKLSANTRLDILEKSLKNIVSRHEVLRTVIKEDDYGRSYQLILDDEKYPFEIKNVKNIINTVALDERLKNEINRIYDLSKEYPIRVCLYELISCGNHHQYNTSSTKNNTEYYLSIVIHHIAFDGWSGNIFLKELQAYYSYYLKSLKDVEAKLDLPGLSIQYKDFALWQKSYLIGERFDEQLNYWKKKLKGYDGLNLVSDRPRPKQIDYTGNTIDFELNDSISIALRELAKELEVSLHGLLLSGYYLMLRVCSSQDDIVIGTPVANRHYSQIKNSIGFFVNTLALRIEITPQTLIREFIQAVGHEVVGAQLHQDLPFEKLVEELKVPKDTSRHPIFQVMFAVQSFDEALHPYVDKTVEGSDLAHLLQPYGASSNLHNVAQFDITTFIDDSQDCLRGSFNYAVSLYNKTTINGFIETYKQVLNQFAGLTNNIQSQEQNRIEDLTYLNQAQYRQIIHAWNQTEKDYIRDKTITQLFEEQVERTPDNIAVVYTGLELTYKQLNEKANQLAHYLRSLGVGPDTLVAIAVERSLEMIIGLLGILKAGGAYVPLDPDYPQERLQYMLDDTGAKVFITQGHLQEKLKQTLAAYRGMVVVVDQVDQLDLVSLVDKVGHPGSVCGGTVLSQQSIENPVSCTLPHHLAYVIYTSGSTGRPKGVMVEHGGIVNCIYAIKHLTQISPDETFLALTSISFDVATLDYYLPLSIGSKIILASQTNQKDGFKLISLMNKFDISIVQGTPSIFRMLIETEQCLDLKIKIMLAGETLSKELSYELVQSNQVFNIYGPTEGTIYSTLSQIRENSHISIGRPISNTQIYILDSCMNPVPVGIAGEIYIGGAGLARGYLNRADLTAEKFVPNPFVRKEEVVSKERIGKKVIDGKALELERKSDLRLYRTGDLARYLPDGNIEFLGRIDDQVKIRGFRIELGEIESTLSIHGDVAQAVVIAREDEPGHKQLVAYVVLDEKGISSLTVESTLTSSSGTSFSVLNGESLLSLTEDLRNHLAKSVPEYMVPSFFVYLDKIPLTPNGKIDRKVLPAPDLSLRQVGDEYVAPKSQIEQELCAIWSAVLRIEKIGIYDNFFKLGGDSIISIQLVAKARQKGIHFAVKDVFNYPTIAGLALAAKAAQENALTLNSLVVKPEQGIVKGDIPLTPIQHWFFEKNLANKNHFNQASLLQIHGHLDPSLLRKAFEFLITHHDALRCCYAKDDITGAWKQTNLTVVEEDKKDIAGDPSGDIESIWTSIDLSDLEVKELPTRIEQESNIFQQSLSIENGPLIKVALFDCGANEPTRLLIVIHHLVVDGVSWRILLEDLEHVYQTLESGRELPILTKTHSYQQWSHTLASYAKSSELEKQIPYWQKIQEAMNQVQLPVDFDKDNASNFDSGQVIALSLTEEETTALLQKVPKAYRTQINDILLTALTLAIGDWTKNYSLSFSLEGHGRENINADIDTSRTVGWFTSIFPVYLTINNPTDLGEAIKIVKEELRGIPDKGIGYGILAYLTQHLDLSSASTLSSSMSSCSHPTLSFNYLGQWDNTLSYDGLFSFASESSGSSVAEDHTDSYLLNINSEVRQGVFSISFGYSSNNYRQETIEKVAKAFIDRLKELIKHCSCDNVFGYTASDFNQIILSQASLDTSFGNIVGIESIYPLAPMQSGLLFQALYAPTSDAYFVQSIFELEKEVDARALQSAWQIVSDHHPILRTGIIWEKLEEPLQYVLESAEVPFEIHDWQDAKVQQQIMLEDFIQADRKKGFDLSKAPLLRLALIKCAKDKHYLVWSQHHILTDGWCGPIILGDVFKAYQDIKQGKEPRLTTRRPYGDYITWLKEQDVAGAEAFWREYLEDLEGPTRLSFKDIIEENLEKDYGTYAINLSTEETDQIRNFAKENDLTLNTVVQGAVATVLKTYTQQQEVVMGVTVSGRSITLPGVEEMVGLFINTLPLRVTYNPGESTVSFLTRLQTQAQKLSEHTYIPLAQVQSLAGFSQGLFDVIFVFENYPLGEDATVTKNSLKICNVQGITKTEYPLTISIGLGKQLHLSLSYQTKHFNEELIQRLISHIRQVLKNISCKEENSNETSKYIGTFSLLTSTEKHQLLIEWNDTKTDYPEARNKTITQLFEEQVERTPDNIAVVYTGLELTQELTYKQLNEKANQLAHYLRSLGVGPDILVAIAVERSLEMIIGLLGILKAGGAYVPLDPDYPQERLQYMLDDTGAKVFITQGHLQEKLKQTLAAYRGMVVVVDQVNLVSLVDKVGHPGSVCGGSIFSQQSIENPVSCTLPHHLAYVIYTSGSTGRPKGVMIEHGNLNHYLNYSREVYFAQKEAATLLHSSIAFDMSITSLYVPLTTGSVIYIPLMNSLSNSLEEISQELDRINFLKLTPTHLRALNNQSTSWDFNNKTRCLVIGGENLLKEDMAFIYNNSSSSFSTTSIFNEYGPTETTVGCCTFKIEHLDNLSQISIPIGRPISNTQIYILDSCMNPVPVGIAGEIYIGGAGLARGYLNRADLTAEKFVPNPFVWKEEVVSKERIGKKVIDGKALELERNKSDLRLYRTGDLARYLPDGNIEFLGRIDDQVKIRGFRIELGEIESTLSIHGDVAQAVVIAREDGPSDRSDNGHSSDHGPGHKQLVAYVVPEEFSPSNTELREFLSEKLPDYMIPAFFVYLDKIPLTSNGKIDQKVLPAPDLSLRQVGDEYVAPKSQIEQELCAIWSAVLRIEKIGIYDNFFKLGGHSLLAVQLIMKINQVIHKKLSVMDIFQNPTVTLLAHLIQSDIENISSSPIFCIQSNGKNPPLFLIHPGGGLAYSYAKLAKYITDIQIYGINHPNFIDPSIIFNNIEEVAQLYISLIKKEQKEGPYFLGGWSYGGLVAYEMARQLCNENSEVKQLILIDPSSPYLGKFQHNCVPIEDRPYIERSWKFMTPKIKEKIEKNLELASFKITKYKLRNYNGSIVLLKAENSLEEPNLIEDCGWREIAKKIRVIDIPGKHDDLFGEKYIQSTAQAIKNAYWTVYR